MGMTQGTLVPGDANPIDASAPLLSDILTHSWSPKAHHQVQDGIVLDMHG